MKITKSLLATLSAATLATTLFVGSQAAADTGANARNDGQNASSPIVVAPTPTPQAKAEINKIDFLNYSFQSPSCAEDLGIAPKIKISKGKFKSGADFYNVKDNKIIYGDVNGDGREDAIVPIDCGNTTGTFRSFEIHAFESEGAKAKSIAVLDFNQVTNDYTKHFPDGYVFSTQQNGVSIVKGNLVVNVLTDGSFAMPENISTFVYKLSGDKFTLTAKPVKRKFKP